MLPPRRLAQAGYRVAANSLWTAIALPMGVR